MTLNRSPLLFSRRSFRTTGKRRSMRNERNRRNFSGVFLSAISVYSACSAFSKAFSPRLSRRTISIHIICFLVFAGAAQAQDARKIMEGVYKQDTSRDTTWRGKMDVVDKKGTVRSKKFAMRKLGGLGNSKTLARFTDPPEVRGVGLLSINVGGAADRQWLYTPAFNRVRRVAAQERRQRFIGTDFTNEDMAERVLDDFTYKLIGEGEVIEGRKTYKLEAVDPMDGKSAAFTINDKQFEALFDQLKSSGLTLTIHANINGKQFAQPVKEHEHEH